MLLLTLPAPSRRPRASSLILCAGCAAKPGVWPHTCEHGGATFHFCDPGCRTKFLADPKKYLEPDDHARCPACSVWHDLHVPDGPRDPPGGPGTCPICGMALEPELVSLDDAPNPELVDSCGGSKSAAALTVPVFVLGDGRASRVGAARRARRRIGCSSLLATPVVLWAGWPFFQRGWTSLGLVKLNMFTLIAHRHRRGMAVQRRRDALPRALSRRVPDGTVRSTSTSKRRRSSSRWCCSARCWNCSA